MQTQDKKTLPNASKVIGLGIFSVFISCCCPGVISILFGGIALYLYKKDIQLYSENPEGYSNYSDLKTGRILSIIGIVIGTLGFLLSIAFNQYLKSNGLNQIDFIKEAWGLPSLH